MMSFLYIDIETLPIQSEEKARQFVADAKAPGNIKKPESIEKWREENADEILAKTSFDAVHGRICCICAEYEGRKFRAMNDEADDEASLISIFDYLGEAIGTYMPVIVGHNVIGFDLPFIRKRAMIHGIRLPAWFPRDLRPWGDEVFDTMLQWDAKNFISQDALAAAFGIDHDATMDGSMVAGRWREGKRQEVADYCAGDVALSRQIHEHMRRAL